MDRNNADQWLLQSRIRYGRFWPFYALPYPVLNRLNKNKMGFLSYGLSIRCVVQVREGLQLTLS